MDTQLPSPGLSLAEPADYFALMKPRVMLLVVFTALVGLVCAPGTINAVLALASIICIAAGAGAAGVLNMWYDRDIDAKMTRTRKRPLPAGRMDSDSALGFGLLISALSVLGLAFASNYYAAALLAFTIFFYAVVYTVWLKRNTPQNIVIGGAAGAFPPMIGWAAADGTTTDPLSIAMLAQAFTFESFLLFLIIFLWTPPHFWALALYKRGDYAKADIPMMPNVKGARSTRTQIFIYAILLAVVAISANFTALGSPLSLAGSILLSAMFVVLAFRVLHSQAGETEQDVDAASLYAVKSGDQAARNLFAYSTSFLFAVFALFAISGMSGG